MNDNTATTIATANPAGNRSQRAFACLLTGTLVVAIAEWMMLEVLRTPYDPPADMLTFLGREKYGLISLMCFTACAWLLVSTTILIVVRLSLRDHFLFVTLLATIAAGLSYIIRNPHRPVTPWQVIWN